MTIYDEFGNVLENPDLTKGEVTEEKVKTGEHIEYMPGTEGLGDDGKGLQRLVTDYEFRHIFRPFTVDPMNEVNERLAELESMVDMLTMLSLDSREDELAARVEAAEEALDMLVMSNLED